MDETGAEVLAHAMEQLTEGAGRTRPVSVSLPGPLADALQRLSDQGVINSTSAAATEALTLWAYNRLLRLTLDDIYDQEPELRPSRDQVLAMADRLGVSLPKSAWRAA